MESIISNKFEDTEEFSSNESGWTKYIASPARSENLSSKVNDDGHRDASRKRDDHDNDDDDSVASDASSGPSHFVEISEDGYASSYTKHAEDIEECSKFYSGKKAYKEVKERSGRVANEARINEPIFKGNRATGHVLKQKQGRLNLERRGLDYYLNKGFVSVYVNEETMSAIGLCCWMLRRHPMWARVPSSAKGGIHTTR
ncbi:hypothetical protein Ancab_020965 [Ancistrocladus abbreviatus]